MSCPSWESLLEHRTRADLPAPRGWAAAVEHLEHCRRCRRRALSLDPTLLFVGQAPLTVEDEEVDAIRTGVRTLVRSRAAERATQRLRRGLGRFAAAAAAVALLVLTPTHTARQAGSGAGSGAAPGAIPSPSPLASADGLLEEAPAPVIEPLDLPAARIYMLGERDLPIVMVVDDSIDV